VTSSQVSVGAWLAFAQLTAPILLVTLVIGLLAGMVQTATQIREQSVPFVLKMAGLAALTTTAGPFMMQGLESYATNLMNALPGLVHG
jgi:flagellar biosynthesis protein FliQ